MLWIDARNWRNERNIITSGAARGRSTGFQRWKLYFINKLRVLNKYLMEHWFKHIFLTLFNYFFLTISLISNNAVFCPLKIKMYLRYRSITRAYTQQIFLNILFRNTDELKKCCLIGKIVSPHPLKNYLQFQCFQGGYVKPHHAVLKHDFNNIRIHSKQQQLQQSTKVAKQIQTPKFLFQVFWKLNVTWIIHFLKLVPRDHQITWPAVTEIVSTTVCSYN